MNINFEDDLGTDSEEEEEEEEEEITDVGTVNSFFRIFNICVLRLRVLSF